MKVFWIRSMDSSELLEQLAAPLPGLVTLWRTSMRALWLPICLRVLPACPAPCRLHDNDRSCGVLPADISHFPGNRSGDLSHAATSKTVSPS